MIYTVLILPNAHFFHSFTFSSLKILLCVIPFSFDYIHNIEWLCKCFWIEKRKKKNLTQLNHV